MIKTIITFLAICFCMPVYAQQAAESDGFTRTRHGYLFYINGDGEYVTFIPVKTDKIKNKLSNFDTKNLGIGYQINTRHINTDSLNKYGRTYKLEDKRSIPSKITVVPITLTYHIYGFGSTEEEILAKAHEESYIFSKKRITVQVTGGVSFRIMSSTPKVYYFKTWE